MSQESRNPASPESGTGVRVESPRDILLFGLDSAISRMRETLRDITDEEYDWEPLPASERAADMALPPDRKRVWRVHLHHGAWVCDYTPGILEPPPFTTIAWIMCHVGVTAEMYLHCIRTGEPEGVGKTWDDIPIPGTRQAMTGYIFDVFSQVWDYLSGIPERQVVPELNRPTPAPWGEMRPAYVNLWGGIIEHAIEHNMQIAVRKERIREGY